MSFIQKIYVTIFLVQICVLIVCGRSVDVHMQNINTDRQGGSCILDVNRDLPKKNEPLFLEGNGKTMVFPEAEGRRGIIALRQGQEVIVACPGTRNFLETTRAETSRAVCRSGSTLVVDGREVSSTQLDCNARATASTRITSRRCANGKGTIIQLGFQTPAWTQLVEVCHNIPTSETYYSHHMVNGDRLAGKVYRPGGTRPGFARGDRQLFGGFNPDVAYSRRNQEAVLTRLLGKSRADELLDSRTLFLSRGHLSPDADFLFSPHQFLTYFYVNVAPQWQAINAGNWLRIEENTRRLASRLGADLEVVTGTNGVLRLRTEKGDEREIRLEGDRLPVPELFWKVLRNSQDDSCIAFVASNNPFATGPPRQICTDVCSRTNWPVLQNDLQRGYVYCCEYADFKRAIPEMPDLACRSTLTGR